MPAVLGDHHALAVRGQRRTQAQALMAALATTAPVLELPTMLGHARAMTMAGTIKPVAMATMWMLC